MTLGDGDCICAFVRGDNNVCRTKILIIESEGQFLAVLGLEEYLGP